MIRKEEITLAGRFNKPHGIKGEISATLDLDADLEEVRCIIVEIDGIFVPFFINSVRGKTADTDLITIDGIDSDEKARQLALRPFYLLNSDVEDGDIDFEDGFYASDLIGFTVNDRESGVLGRITDVNDSTENVLFIISTDDGHETLLPVADEFIIGVDAPAKTVETSYPVEIIELNKK